MGKNHSTQFHQHHHLGKIQIINNLIVLKTVLYSLDQLKFWQYKIYNQPKHSFILYPVQHSINMPSCNSNVQLFISYPFYPFTLKNQLQNRHISGFSEQQVWNILYLLLSTAKQVQIGDLNQENIWINKNGMIKIATKYSWPKKITAFEKVVNKCGTGILSPQQLKKLNVKTELKSHDPKKSESFCIGIFILSLMSLTNYQTFYKGDKLLPEKIQQQIKSCQKKYSKFLIAILNSMLQINCDYRSIPQTLLQILKKYQNPILRFQKWNYQLQDLKKIQYLAKKKLDCENKNNNSICIPIIQKQQSNQMLQTNQISQTNKIIKPTKLQQPSYRNSANFYASQNQKPLSNQKIFHIPTHHLHYQSQISKNQSNNMRPLSNQKKFYPPPLTQRIPSNQKIFQIPTYHIPQSSQINKKELNNMRPLSNQKKFYPPPLTQRILSNQKIFQIPTYHIHQSSSINKKELNNMRPLSNQKKLYAPPLIQRTLSNQGKFQIPTQNLPYSSQIDKANLKNIRALSNQKNFYVIPHIVSSIQINKNELNNMRPLQNKNNFYSPFILKPFLNQNKIQIPTHQIPYSSQINKNQLNIIRPLSNQKNLNASPSFQRSSNQKIFQIPTHHLHYQSQINKNQSNNMMPLSNQKNLNASPSFQRSSNQKILQIPIHHIPFSSQINKNQLNIIRPLSNQKNLNASPSFQRSSNQKIFQIPTHHLHYQSQINKNQSNNMMPLSNQKNLNASPSFQRSSNQKIFQIPIHHLHYQSQINKNQLNIIRPLSNQKNLNASPSFQRSSNQKIFQIPTHHLHYQSQINKNQSNNMMPLSNQKNLNASPSFQRSSNQKILQIPIHHIPFSSQINKNQLNIIRPLSNQKNIYLPFIKRSELKQRQIQDKYNIRSYRSWDKIQIPFKTKNQVDQKILLLPNNFKFQQIQHNVNLSRNLHKQNSTNLFVQSQLNANLLYNNNNQQLFCQRDQQRNQNLYQLKTEINKNSKNQKYYENQQSNCSEKLFQIENDNNYYNNRNYNFLQQARKKKQDEGKFQAFNKMNYERTNSNSVEESLQYKIPLNVNIGQLNNNSIKYEFEGSSFSNLNKQLQFFHQKKESYGDKIQFISQKEKVIEQAYNEKFLFQRKDKKKQLHLQNSNIYNNEHLQKQKKQNKNIVKNCSIKQQIKKKQEKVSQNKSNIKYGLNYNQVIKYQIQKSSRQHKPYQIQQIDKHIADQVRSIQKYKQQQQNKYNIQKIYYNQNQKRKSQINSRENLYCIQNRQQKHEEQKINQMDKKNKNKYKQKQQRNLREEIILQEIQRQKYQDLKKQQFYRQQNLKQIQIQQQIFKKKSSQYHFQNKKQKYQNLIQHSNFHKNIIYQTSKPIVYKPHKIAHNLKKNFEPKYMQQKSNGQIFDSYSQKIIMAHQKPWSQIQYSNLYSSNPYNNYIQKQRKYKNDVPYYNQSNHSSYYESTDRIQEYYQNQKKLYQLSPIKYKEYGYQQPKNLVVSRVLLPKTQQNNYSRQYQEFGYQNKKRKKKKNISQYKYKYRRQQQKKKEINKFNNLKQNLIKQHCNESKQMMSSQLKQLEKQINERIYASKKSIQRINLNNL